VRLNEGRDLISTYPKYVHLQLQHVQIMFGSAIPASLLERLAVVRREMHSETMN